jgi:hypothetical protein
MHAQATRKVAAGLKKNEKRAGTVRGRSFLAWGDLEEDSSKNQAISICHRRRIA